MPDTNPKKQSEINEFQKPYTDEGRRRFDNIFRKASLPKFVVVIDHINENGDKLIGTIIGPCSSYEEAFNLGVNAMKDFNVPSMCVHKLTSPDCLPSK